MSAITRRWAVAVTLTLAAWCFFELALRRRDPITDDWQGWRQADTQAIARNLAFEELDPLRPRIDWRGDGPGYVETELQIYATLIAVTLRAARESVWPGQLISLVSVALAAALLAATLARRFGPRAGYGALLATLSMQGVVIAGTTIQPDPLAFLAFTTSFVFFAAWLETPTNARLVAWVTATAIAGLLKPTTLEVGVAQGALVLLAHRSALRRPSLWLGWASVLIVVGASMLHARGLYLSYGNTFGVLSGGDSKLPDLHAATRPGTWIGLLRFFVVWGVGLPGAAALSWLAARRRLGAEEIALSAGALALALVALRYMSGPFGTHYHLPHVVLGAWLVAHAIRDLEEGKRLPKSGRAGVLLFAAAGVCTALLYLRAIRYVRALPPEPESAVGRMLAEVAPPGTLVVVRARAPRRDPDWRTPNNFEDPRVFYISRTRGWVIANDDVGAQRLAEHAARGARFYAHVNQIVPDAELTTWLDAHAEVARRGPEGTVYRLK